MGLRARFGSLHLRSAQQQGDSSVVADENDKRYVGKSDSDTWVNGGSIQGPSGPSGDPGAATTTFRLVHINPFEASDLQLIQAMISASVWGNQ